MHQRNAESTRNSLLFLSESAGGEAQRTIALLSAIEATVDALNGFSKHFRVDLDTGVRFLSLVLSCEFPIDPHGDVCASIEKSQSILANLYRAFGKNKVSAENDGRICEDDGVVDAYTQAMEALTALYDIMEDLRHTILEHDLSFEKVVGKSFSSVEELFQDILKN
jgi:hypothetical protein